MFWNELEHSLIEILLAAVLESVNAHVRKLSTPITLISANGIFAVHKDTALLRIFRSNTFKSFTKSDTTLL